MLERIHTSEYLECSARSCKLEDNTEDFQTSEVYTFDVQKTIFFKTDKKRQLVDITEDVEREIAKSKIAEGVVIVFARHTTCALIILEIEDKLEEDFLNYFEKEGPKGPFSHSHGDYLAHDPKHAGKSHTPAHILSAIIGQSVSIPLKNGQMLLGTWQRICLTEFDGPRKREIMIQTLE